MTRAEYLAKRTALLDEAQNLLTENKVKDYEIKEQEVKDLDAAFETVALAQANMNALKEKVVDKTMIEMKDVSNIIAPVGGSVDEKAVYTDAWIKQVMGKSLSESEKAVFDKVNAEFNNAFTHTTALTTLIPETVVAGIWKRAEEMYPLLADVKKFNVRGTLIQNRHTAITSGDAAWYAEGTDTDDEENAFDQVTLTGCELSKAVTVSWKLKSMSVEEFLPYIQNELGQRVGAVLGTAMYSGTGVAGVQPQGTIVAINAEGGTPQKVTYTADNGVDPLSYDKITEAISKIHSGYLGGAAIYATNATIWGSLANLMDAVGRPLFIPEVTASGVGRMFGMLVKTDAGAGVGNILIGNAQQGYIFNTNEPLSLATEDHVKARETDYAAYTVVDGKVLDTKAFALLDLI